MELYSTEQVFWLSKTESTTTNLKLIVGGIYIPPDANNNYWRLLEQSIDQAFNTNCDNLLFAGDCNVNVQTYFILQRPPAH